MQWGLLGLDRLESTRRTRTLGLSNVTRWYNEQAVPGMGNIWFARQLYVALLGIEVAERVKENNSNIIVANAIEAMGCWLALRSLKGDRDPRVRGAIKLANVDNTSFAYLSKKNSYVTQPMRMSTVQPLKALGLVESNSDRFNTYRCSELGRQFLAYACKEYRPFQKEVNTYLVQWIEGGVLKNTPTIQKALSPVEPLSLRARNILLNLIITQGNGAQRRAAIINWFKQDKLIHNWAKKPDCIEKQHWHDLHAGALFFLLKKEALTFLDWLEYQLERLSANRQLDIARLPKEETKNRIKLLHDAAKAYLNTHDNKLPVKEAYQFALECIQSDNRLIIKSLVGREGIGLRICGDQLIAGAAFKGEAVNELTDAQNNDSLTQKLPMGISFRVRNLFLLHCDLKGKLDSWLGTVNEESENDD